MVDVSLSVVGDKVDLLAAKLNMFSRFKALQQHASTQHNPLLHLLYEWNMGEGSREKLVNALKHIGLHNLADQYVYNMV